MLRINDTGKRKVYIQRMRGSALHWMCRTSLSFSPKRVLYLSKRLSRDLMYISWYRSTVSSVGSSIFGTVIGSPTKTERETVCFGFLSNKAPPGGVVTWALLPKSPDPKPRRRAHLWLWWACRKARCPRSCWRKGRSRERDRGRSLRASAASFARSSSSSPPQKSPACRRRSLRMSTPGPGRTWGQKQRLLPIIPARMDGPGHMSRPWRPYQRDLWFSSAGSPWGLKLFKFPHPDGESKAGDVLEHEGLGFFLVLTVYMCASPFEATLIVKLGHTNKIQWNIGK